MKDENRLQIRYETLSKWVRKDKHQRIVYSVMRLIKAVDRASLAKTPESRKRALAWARLWAKRGQFDPFKTNTG